MFVVPFENNCRLGVRNTRLIKLYQDLDPRVGPLLCAMRYLGTRMGFSGKFYVVYIRRIIEILMKVSTCLIPDCDSQVPIKCETLP